MNRLFAALLCIVIAGPAYAEPPAKALYAGQPAPFDGLLVPPGRVLELNEAELKVDDLNLRLTSKKLECQRIEKVYVAKLEAATAPPAWYEKPKVVFWAGVVVGVAATSAALYGASALTK